MNDPVQASPGEPQPASPEPTGLRAEQQLYYSRAVGDCVARLQRCVEQLQSPRPRTSRQDALLDEINHQTRRLNTLLRHVLVAADLGVMTTAVEAPALALAARLADLVAEYRAGSPSHSFVLDCPEDASASIQAWPCLDVTLQLLLANALRCTPPGGTIGLTAQDDAAGAQWHFAVSDGGPGLSPGALAQIFENPGRAAPHLYGLAISLARYLVETMGGRFWVESRPGQGTTFHCGLPKQSVIRRWTVPRPRVLVIDADAELCTHLKTSYEEAGFDVQLSAPGEAGLAEARAYRPQLVLFGLPARPLDGLSELLGLRQHSSAAVICLAPMDDKAAIAEALWQGASDCLVKPFNVRELLARTRAILRRHSVSNEPAFSMSLGPLGFGHTPRAHPILQ